MATVMLMEWQGITPDQYTQVMKNLGLDGQKPAGGMFHVAGFLGGSLRVLDIWESQQTFETFQRDRLMAAVQKAGITAPPTSVQFFPVYNLFVPNPEAIRTAGASSLPK
jgi:hypothetical protein